MNDQARSDVPKDALGGVVRAFAGAADMKPQALEFKMYKGPIFEVEAAQDGEDFVFHFFMPTTSEFWDKMGISVNQRSQAFLTQYWEEIFPLALDRTSRSYFKAEFPRLSAMHMVQTDCSTEFDGKQRPLDSWWMRAKGFVHNTLDPEAFIDKFYRALEESLVNRKRM